MAMPVRQSDAFSRSFFCDFVGSKPSRFGLLRGTNDGEQTEGERFSVVSELSVVKTDLRLRCQNP